MATDPARKPAHSQPRSSGSPRARPVLFLGLVALVLASARFLWVSGALAVFDGRGGLSAMVEIRSDPPAAGRFPGDRYIGSKACAECHPGEYAQFTRSGHA